MPIPPPKEMLVVKEDHPSYDRPIPDTLETTVTLEYTKKPQATREGRAEQSIYSGTFRIGDEEVKTEYRLKLIHGPNLLDIILQQNGRKVAEQRFAVDDSHIPIHDDSILVTYARDLRTVRITAPESKVSLVDETYDPNEIPAAVYVEPKKERRQRPTTEEPAEQSIEQPQEQEEQQQYNGEPIVLRAQLHYSPMKILEEIAERVNEPGVISNMWSQARSRARALTGTLSYTPLDTHGLEVPAERIERFVKAELPSRYHNILRVEDLPTPLQAGDFKSLDVVREEFIRKDPVHGDTNFETFLEEVAENNEFTIGEQTYTRDELVQGDQVHVMLVELYKDL